MLIKLKRMRKKKSNKFKDQDTTEVITADGVAMDVEVTDSTMDKRKNQSRNLPSQ